MHLSQYIQSKCEVHSSSLSDRSISLNLIFYLSNTSTSHQYCRQYAAVRLGH